MVITELEARVPADKWRELRQAFNNLVAQGLPPPMVRSALVQNAADMTMWRIVSTWRSREALDEYRASVDTPGGVLLFRGLGVEPALAVFEVAGHAPTEG